MVYLGLSKMLGQLSLKTRGFCVMSSLDLANAAEVRAVLDLVECKAYCSRFCTRFGVECPHAAGPEELIRDDCYRRPVDADRRVEAALDGLHKQSMAA